MYPSESISFSRARYFISLLKLSAMEHVNVQMKNHSKLRIVLVGKTGVGKSATGNTILREEAFKSEISFVSVTSECHKVENQVWGRPVAVIDTPGLFDTKHTNEEIQEKIKSCISLCAPGPHVFLVVIQLGRFTEEEKKTVEIIKEIFGECCSKYIVVLFTHGEKLRNNTIQNFIRDSSDLSNFITSTSGRYHVFNNEAENPAQVTTLLDTIDQLIIENGGQCYTNEMLQMAELAIQEEQQRLLRNNKSMDPQEARDKAERNNSFMTTAAGFGMSVAVLAALALSRGHCTIL